MSDPDEDDDDSTSAADDPTAMWDDDALRKAGMHDIAGQLDQRERGPATAYGVKGDARDSVVVGGGVAPPPPVTRGRPARTGGLSWTLTLLLAVALGAAVYALVRLLK